MYFLKADGICGLPEGFFHKNYKLFFLELSQKEAAEVGGMILKQSYCHNQMTQTATVLFSLIRKARTTDCAPFLDNVKALVFALLKGACTIPLHFKMSIGSYKRTYFGMHVGCLQNVLFHLKITKINLTLDVYFKGPFIGRYPAVVMTNTKLF